MPSEGPRSKIVALRALDLGCGTGRDIVWLCLRGQKSCIAVSDNDGGDSNVGGASSLVATTNEAASTGPVNKSAAAVLQDASRDAALEVGSQG